MTCGLGGLETAVTGLIDHREVRAVTGLLAHRGVTAVAGLLDHRG